MPGGAVVVGRGETAHPLWASVVNGAASHVLELDDVERAAYLHPGIAPISAALAAVALMPQTGELDLLRAIVAGYEVGIRVGWAVNPSHYRFWHTSGTAGAFAAAAAAAVVLGLDCERTQWALGNAGTEAAGLWQFNPDGALTKPYHIGMAALHGLLAALAAREGLSGAHRILEGDQGFLAAMSDDPHPERLVNGLGEGTPAILGISRKRWASCRFTHAPIDAVLKARQEGPITAVERILVETFDTAVRVAGHTDPKTPQEAKFSIAYCCTLAWLTGRADVDGFDAAEQRAKPEFTDLFRRVEVRVNERFESMIPDFMPAAVTVVWRDGRRTTYEVIHPVGDPEDPIRGPLLDDKVCGLLRSAGWPEEKITRARRLVYALGDSAVNAHLAELLTLL